MPEEHIHNWFGLTYSSYLVLQRSILQSMPEDWQKRFVDILEEAYAVVPDDCPSIFMVRAKHNGKFIRDPYGDYQRGSRKVILKEK